MRVVCAVGVRGGAELVQHALSLVAGASPELLLVHVIDEGPRHDVEHITGPLRHGPRGGPERRRILDLAEDAAGTEALDEARAAAGASGATATTRLARGNPERAIVEVAEETGASLVVIRAREHPESHPPRGPKSIGHTARFVVDHAPCDVLLVRAG